jgi:thioredoxin 1
MQRSTHILLILCISLALASQSCSDDPSASQNAGPADSQQETNNTITRNDTVKVTFVELGSVNCIPCKMMQPIMEEIEKEYAGQVKVVFHDVWTEQGQPYAREYGIRVIPTQVFLDKRGREYFRHEGFFPKEELVQILKQQGVK